MFSAVEEGVSQAPVTCQQRLQDVSSNILGWGLTSLPPERRFGWEPSPYSGQHCTPGELPRRLWVFSESTVQGCLSLLQTGSPSHTVLSLDGTDGTDNLHKYLCITLQTDPRI